MKKSYHFCTHGVGIGMMAVFGLLGLYMTRMPKFHTDPLYPVLLVICEVAVVAYSIYIWFCFALKIDEKGIRLLKGQSVIRIDWDQVSSISIVEQLSTRRMMLTVKPLEYVREKKLRFGRSQTTETIETDVLMKYVDAIRQFYDGEIFGVNRLEDKLKGSGKTKQ